MKLMFHYIKKEKNNSPTIVANRIKEIIKHEDFQFFDLNQTQSANGFISFKLISKLSSEIKKNDPDIIVLSGIASAFHAAIAAKKCGIKKRILITHGIESLNLDRSWFKRQIFKFIIEPLTIILSTDIQCNSKFVYDYWTIKLLAFNKRHLIYNPMPTISNNYLKKSIDKNCFTVISASRIIKNKGYDILIDAIKKIEDNRIKFIIAGDGEYLDTIKKELKNKKNVSIVGKVTNNKLLQLFSKSNLFVLPSRLYETYGLVYMEAALAKIPSICGNRGAVKELINDKTGYVLNQYDSSELAKLILYAANHKKENDKKGKEIYSRLIDNNSNENISQQIISLYKI